MSKIIFFIKMTWKSYVSHPWTLLFFYCLLIATFVTVAIYVYAGEQQYLETRKFGNVDVSGNLDVDGHIIHSAPAIKNNTTVVNLSGSTVNLQDYMTDTNTHYLFVVDSSSATTMTMPTTSFLLDALKSKGTNVMLDWGTVVNIGSGTVTQNYNTSAYDNLIAMRPITDNSGTLAQNVGVGLLYQYYKDESGTENVIWYEGPL